jgi:putative glutamine amidotransferase
MSASALRYEAVVGARALLAGVFRAGGEPVLVLPHAPDGVADEEDVAARLARADAVLLPGGGDIHPQWYGGQADESVYDVDLEQDAFDFAVARWALRTGTPLLAVCRGLQVVNIALGGDLVTDMPHHHRHVISTLRLAPGTRVREAVGRDQVTISCFHHQALARLGHGLCVVATGADGVVEAVELTEPRGWFLGLQWHPEDTAADDPAQQALFDAFVAAARRSVPNNRG